MADRKRTISRITPQSADKAITQAQYESVLELVMALNDLAGMDGEHFPKALLGIIAEMGSELLEALDECRPASAEGGAE